MGRYDDLAAVLRVNGLSSQLTPLASSEIEKVRADDSNVPQDYIDFLHEIGYGELDGYMFYSGLIAADEIYSEADGNRLNQLLLFGDDFQGYCAGFDRDHDWAIVEIDPTNLGLDQVGESFEEFVRKKFMADLVNR